MASHKPFSVTVSKTQHVLVITWHQRHKGYHLNKEDIRLDVPKIYRQYLGDLAQQPVVVSSPRLRWPWQGKKHVLHLEFDNKAPPKNAYFTLHYSFCSVNGQCFPPIAQKIYPAQAALMHEVVGFLFPDKIILWQLVLGFIGFGLMMALTPCVWPMIPIVAAMVLGKGRSMAHGCLLTLGYGLGMCCSYSMLGLVFAYAGLNVQGWMQQPWLIAMMAVVLSFLALAMLEIIPLYAWMGRSRDHRLFRLFHWHVYHAFFAGFLASLVLSPCITPPLFVALTFMTQWGDWFYGVLALFSLGIGLSLPLFLVPLLGGQLPRLGVVSLWIKELIALLLLAIVFHLLAGLLPHIPSFLWVSFLCLIVAWRFLWALRQQASGCFLWIQRGLGVLALLFALGFVVQSLQRPLFNQSSMKPGPPAAALSWHTVHSEQALMSLLLAQKGKKPVLLYFRADWCAVCRQLDQDLWPDAQLHRALKQWFLIKVDISQQDKASRQLMRLYGVFAPPVIRMINRQGLLSSRQLIGLASTSDLFKLLRQK